MGRLAAVKLVHLYGYVSCHTAGPTFWSYWGCGDNPWNGLNTQVNVVITDSNNHILLPPSQFLNTKITSLKWYKVPGYNSLSPELVLHFFTSPKWVHPNQELRVWYGENLVNLSEGDNGGTVCADVYALFVWHKRFNWHFFKGFKKSKGLKGILRYHLSHLTQVWLLNCARFVYQFSVFTVTPSKIKIETL